MAEGGGHKIIILDDDDFLVQMYVTKFSNSGIEISAFKSGQDLLEKLKGGENADLLLLDIVIPNMTGLEVLREMRKEKLLEGVPVVMLTNQNDSKDIEEAKALGIAGYIVKSAATPSEVVAEVLKIINNSKH